MHSLKLIAGLGNPGRKHERDRHNVGFWFASRLVVAQRIELKSVAKYHGLLGKLGRPTGDLWLLLPDLHEPLGEIGRRARAFLQDPAAGNPGRARRDRFSARRRKAQTERRGRRPQRPEGRRGAARHPWVLASADRDRPPGKQGPRRWLRADAAARGRARADRSGARSLHGGLGPVARWRHGSGDAQAAHETLMSLKCGIVGLPNVGKSTLFNALTKAGIAAENYPFCTIDPNIGIVEVP